MNTMHKLLFIASIFSSIALPIELTLTPENTVFSFDIDEVTIEKPFWHKEQLIIGGILQNIFGATDYIRAFLEVRNAYKYDKQINTISGLTFHYLYFGMHDARLTPYVAWMIQNMERSRCFIDGTRKILKRLKTKGYTIVFATNKDRICYDITAQTLGNEFTNIPTKVFLAHPGNDGDILEKFKNFAELPTTPASYKELEHKARTIQATANILHAPSRKPYLAYFQFMEKTIGDDKNIIFIDDFLENTQGFNKLQETTCALRHGIHFKNAIQLAEELIKLGILSEKDDKKLLDELQYPGIKGRIMQFLSNSL